MHFNFDDEKLKAFSHVIDMEDLGNEITLFLDDGDLPIEEIYAFYEILGSLVNRADVLVKKDQT